jgi:hypothetical protein
MKRILALLCILFLIACTNTQVAIKPAVQEETQETGWVMIALQGKADDALLTIGKVTIGQESKELGRQLRPTEEPILLLQEEVNAGTINVLEFSIEEALLAGQEAFLPTNTYRFNEDIEILPDKTVLLILDLDEKSLLQTNDGPALAPIITLHAAYDVKPTVDSSGVITIEKETEIIAKYGTGSEGRFGVGEAIWEGSELTVINDKLRAISSEIRSEQGEDDPYEEFTLSLYRNTLNPVNIELPKDSLVRLIITSRDEAYTLHFDGIDQTAEIDYTSSDVLEFSTEDIEGAFMVGCKPCYLTPEKMLGQIVIK